MKRLSRTFIPLWFAPRALWALAVIACMCGFAVVLPTLFLLALAACSVLGALVLTDIVLIARMPDVLVERLNPEPFAMRRPSVLTYTIRNASALAISAVIIEAPCDLLEYRLDEVRVTVAPQSRATIDRPVLAVRRGTAHLKTVFVWYETPLALVRRRMRVPAQTEVRVYPDLSAIERYGTLHARNKLIEAGLRRMRLRGVGTEPESVRPWAGGDPFRSINWKATARTGKVMVTQHEVERSQNIMILIDAGRLMTPRIDEQRKLDYAVTAALSIASVAALANDRVGFVAFARDIICAQAPRQQGRFLQHLVSQLHDVEARFEESDYEKAFAFVSAALRKRSLVIFFTDIVDPSAHAATLTHLRSLCRRHMVICAFMNDAAVEDALGTHAQSVQQAYRQSVALALRDERQSASAVLRRLGVRVIDVPAKELTTALIDRYLQIKQRGGL